jgi:hypothetical protein
MSWSPATTARKTQLYSLAEYLHQNPEELMGESYSSTPLISQLDADPPVSQLKISEIVPARGPADRSIVAKISGTNLSSRVQVVWEGQLLPESKVVFRGANELWIEVPSGKPGRLIYCLYL